MQLIANMRLGNVGNVDALKAVVLIPVEIPHVENMLNVLHRVDVAIHVDIAVMCIHHGTARRVFSKFHALERLYGTLPTVLYV